MFGISLDNASIKSFQKLNSNATENILRLSQTSENFEISGGQA